MNYLKKLKYPHLVRHQNFIENMLNSKIRYFLGDIRDYERCEEVTRNVDIVIHAAAIKHVNISEYNPFEVTKTNVIGTENILSINCKQSIKIFINQYR